MEEMLKMYSTLKEIVLSDLDETINTVNGIQYLTLNELAEFNWSELDHKLNEYKTIIKVILDNIQSFNEKECDTNK